MIRCENIHKIYRLGRTNLPVLRGVDLRIEAGKFVAIMGASGSGKSTLLHVLSGLDVPQRGQVYFRGEPMFEPEGIRKIPVGRDEALVGAAYDSAGPTAGRTGVAPMHFEARRDRLKNDAFGFVFQFYHLLPEFDVLENVLLPGMVGDSIGGWMENRGSSQTRALSLLNRVGLQDRLDHRPSELSGGERQRVAIARALMNEPELLFADEPTGNLDARTGREIFELLRELNRGGQTIVMVTHDRDLAKEAHEVVQLVDGRLQ
jgi:ABC-type lipoprotein export system ATPase subunit